MGDKPLNPVRLNHAVLEFLQKWTECPRVVNCDFLPVAPSVGQISEVVSELTVGNRVL